MTLSHGRAFRWTLAAAAACVVATAVFFAARAIHERKLAGLFDGPATPAPAAGMPGECPKLATDLKYWKTRSTPEAPPLPVEDLRPREPVERYEYVDGAARKPYEAMMRRTPLPPGVDAASGATQIVRLLNPSTYEEHFLPEFPTILNPPDNALFPANFSAPFVEWTDARNDLWQVVLRVEGQVLWSRLSREKRVAIGDDAWERLARGDLRGRRAIVEVRGVKRSGLWGRERETVDVSAPVSLAVSPDAADAAVVYRIVTPPFDRTKTPNMYIRRLDEKEDRPFLLSRRQYCFNCHTFPPAGDTVDRIALQVRYVGSEKSELPVYFAVVDLKTGKAVRADLPFKAQMTTFMSWAPDGQRLAYSANQSLVTMRPVVHETQSAGEPESDIAVWDSRTNTTWLVPGASEPETIEIFPCWTPDGKSIIFSRAPAGLHPALTKYQLWIVALDGPNAGKARPIPGAEAPDKSSYYARFSPDGKWFSFTRSDSGTLIKSSSDIWIMRADLTGGARPLESNVPHAADSWHSWSRNGRWLVFASKRDDGIYARLYFTHIGEDGRATPAVELPVGRLPLASFNLPEFVPEPPAVSERALYDSIGVDSPSTFVKEVKGRP